MFSVFLCLSVCLFLWALLPEINFMDGWINFKTYSSLMFIYLLRDSNNLLIVIVYFMVDIRRPISSIESAVLYPPIISLDCDH